MMTENQPKGKSPYCKNCGRGDRQIPVRIFKPEIKCPLAGGRRVYKNNTCGDFQERGDAA
jgi:hypothetical protein